MNKNHSLDISRLLERSFSTEALILGESDLGEKFFDLSKGLLGDLFQKLINYDQKVAIIVSNESAYGERVKELICEHRSHRHIRFFNSQKEAREWTQQNIEGKS